MSNTGFSCCQFFLVAQKVLKDMDGHGWGKLFSGKKKTFYKATYATIQHLFAGINSFKEYTMM